MASMQDLREIYESFCSFGSNRNLATGSTSSLNGDYQMDGAKFSKFCKDTKVIDNKKVTSTDVDILFNQIKAKGARKIGWEEFQQGFQVLAEKRFPSKNSRDAFDSLLHLVSDKGPIARATVTQTNGVYSKLTDTTQYTGSHKLRFDENGVGRGAAGRDQGQATLRHDQIVNRETNSSISHNTYSGSTSNIAGPANNTSVGAAKKRGQTAVVTASIESLEIKQNPSKKADTHSSNSSLHKTTSRSLNSMNVSSSSLNKAGSSTSINKPSTASYTTTTTTKTSGGSVFDRLTNTNGYTGSHKHRFNADGTGRGLNGRETINKGASQDGLAKILRT